MRPVSFDAVPLVLTVQEAADILAISKNTAYDLVRCGKIRGVRVGQQIRIAKEDLFAFIQRN